ncbi:LytR/AlgR family response regulator transcription factor [Sporolituus thermophilus]|uniref:Two component transcriptional regulator, LytTR family n=1 Tax=Sporolituus thermophilus DSM 23256 TaxID=1123285 RepID=A0A1G7PAB0_9FIRM|nr:LytTR family DNA-binding domain-containing protein [Sporolituus thermophilus]SDF83242.1 two component transcriptional regulator, LytTR family [Sporolituus thermophilus DSM 23256]
MNKLKVLIVDDEEIMCRELKYLLEEQGVAEVVGVCYNGEDALAMVGSMKPDAVFLDIRMPGLSGLEVARRLSGLKDPPHVVFVTAFSEFAVEAFEVNALHYILKPFDEQDIEKVMRRLMRVRPTFSQAPRHFRKLCVEGRDRLEVIDVDRIQVIYAKNRMVYIQTVDGEKYTAKHSLQEYEEILDGRQFFRCHRNYIVNVDRIKQLAAWFHRGYMLTLAGKEEVEVPVGRIYAKKLKEYIQF